VKGEQIMSVATMKTPRRQAMNYVYPRENSPEIPLLENGDHIAREEFERRYHAMSSVKKAELIQGRVYMPSPVRRTHSKAHAEIVGWLLNYCAGTEGVEVNDNGTVRMDEENEPQPDVSLRIAAGALGISSISQDDYIEGAPELIVEIAGSSASFDLFEKFEVYQQHGVQEYLVWQIYDHRLDWFELREGQYAPLQTDVDGIIRSRVFPGLYLAVDALLSGDLAQVLAIVQQGILSAEHRLFVQRLQNEEEGAK